MKSDDKTRLPPGWDETRVRGVLEHYESQSEESAVAEDEAAFERTSGALMQIPSALVPRVQRLIARFQEGKKAS